MIEDKTWQEIESAVAEYRRMSPGDSIKEARESLRGVLDGTRSPIEVKRLHHDLTNYLQQRWNAGEAVGKGLISSSEREAVLKQIAALDTKIDDCLAELKTLRRPQP